MDVIAEVGTAFVSILPSAKGFGSKLNGQVTKETKTTGSKIGGSIGKLAAGAFGATAIVGGIAKSISLAKDFDLTIRQVGVASGESGAGLKSLSALAMKMGADTAFSAKDAGDAMLELAKGGLTAAQIKGGALATTLKLAAAGGLELGAASTFIVQGMTTFGLKADQANRVAVALAGGANASTASVESLGQALSQVGPGAKTAGLSLEETVGTLAAFDNAGIKGSDAGTSLKTMLTRLVPATDKAGGAMEAFGLNFVDQKGNIDDISTVAQKLQKHLGGLSQAERTSALATIFGSDASRAASVLMDNGAKGIKKYIAAAKDKSAVDKSAAAATEGAAGAWDAFTGSIETLQIQFATHLLPAFTSVALAASKFINQMLTGKGAAGQIAGVLGTLGGVLMKVAGFLGQNMAAVLAFVAVLATARASSIAYAAVQAVIASVQAAQAVAAGSATSAQIALNAAMRANVIGLIVTAIALLVAGLVIAYKRSETFRDIVNGAFKAVVAVGKFMWKALVTYFQIVANVWLTIAGVIIKGAAKAFGWIPGIGPKIKKLAAGFDKFKDNVNKALNAIKPKEVKVTADTKRARAAIDDIQRRLDHVRNKDVKLNMTVHYMTIGNKPKAPLPGQEFARGTNFAPGGLALVGERGPEIVNLPRGSQVIPNNRIHSAGAVDGGRYALTITNWRDGTGYLSAVADTRVAAHAGVSREAARARR